MTDVADNFNRANGGLGANWLAGPTYAAPTIVASQAAGTAGAGWQIAYWKSTSNIFLSDQHAQITAASGIGGVILRHQASTSSGYLGFGNPGSPPAIYRIDNGAFTLLANVGGAGVSVAGDTIKLDVAGSTISLFRNGTLAGNATDTTYSSGQPGIALYDIAIGDDWSGGPISVSSVTLSAAAGSYTQTGADAPFVLHLIAEGAT